MNIISGFPGVEYLVKRTKTFLCHVLRTGPVPGHVAIVMDGNRRFAKKRHQETWEGHNAGFETLASVLEFCYELGVQAVTVFAFSIENFKRPAYEVDALMKIVKDKLIQVCENGDLADQYGLRIRVIGNRSLLPPDVIEVAEKAEKLTRNNTKAVLNICFPYTSRDDVTNSIRRIVTRAEKGLIDPDSIDEDTIASNMYTGSCPPLDILIRTSGVERFSDFMLWESQHYTMIEFVNILWPDFNCWHMFKAILKWGLQKGNGRYNENLLANDDSDYNLTGDDTLDYDSPSTTFVGDKDTSTDYYDNDSEETVVE
ncbi:Rer2p [Sugiyamaella lignohabitans]|uniref:Alkyl transferase n=1 Tax=Sugiyamaella lignohabitans TaxID=796027 RepID=A0A161HIA6_9ASCO|nr:Rer2p [Sugiyamaella lignohabitans]ANB12157.1 Rer2p [Sugiyamaella lignohabitans]